MRIQALLGTWIQAIASVSTSERCKTPGPGSGRGASSIKFAWEPFSVYFLKAGTVLRSSIRIWRAESGDFEIAWFVMGADGVSQHVFRKVDVSSGS
jgi:hypothetical protein